METNQLLLDPTAESACGIYCHKELLRQSRAGFEEGLDNFMSVVHI
jgi:hypothetical protein